MDTNDFIEMDLQLGEALSEVKKLQAAIAERDRRIEELQKLIQDIIKTAQRSYAQGPIRDGGFPAASGKEVSKEAF
jgi:hypothetical protein